MTSVSESIGINVPAEQVYGLFFETDEIPNVISFVSSAEETGNGTTRWTVEFMGKTRSFEVRLVEAEPHRRIKWESATEGRDFSLEALTEASAEGKTRVTLNADFNLGGTIEKLGLAKGPASMAISHELKNAKKYVEGRFAA